MKICPPFACVRSVAALFLESLDIVEQGNHILGRDFSGG